MIDKKAVYWEDSIWLNIRKMCCIKVVSYQYGQLDTSILKM